MVFGIVTSLSGSKLTLVLDERRVADVPLDQETQFSYFPKPNSAGVSIATNSRISDIVPGDYVLVIRKLLDKRKRKAQQSVQVVTNNYGLPYVVFTDKDLAERVAKAFIHAIVLCHKDDKPSPF